MPQTYGVGQRKITIKDMLEAKYTFATTLLALLIDNYGVEFFEWDPESLAMQLNDDFGAKLPDINENKIWALVTALTTNQFYLYWEVFSQTCKTLSNDEPDFSMFSPVDPEDIAWGVTEVVINDPPDPAAGNNEFSHEVASYAGTVLYQNGIWQPPKILDFVEMPVDPSVDLQTAFTDDADMFAAAQLSQTKHGEELTEHIKQNLALLKQQLLAAPLKNRAPEFEKAVNKQINVTG